MKKLLPVLLLGMLLSIDVYASNKSTYQNLMHDDVMAYFFEDYNHCKKNASTDTMLKNCLIRMYKNMEEQRKVQFNKAEEQALQIDGIFHQVTAKTPMNNTYLKQSHEMFVQYREIECLRIRMSYEPGQMAENMYLTCKIDLTAQRIYDLKS